MDLTPDGSGLTIVWILRSSRTNIVVRLAKSATTQEDFGLQDRGRLSN
jgi:hypothetical protein